MKRKIKTLLYKICFAIRRFVLETLHLVPEADYSELLFKSINEAIKKDKLERELFNLREKILDRVRQDTFVIDDLKSERDSAIEALRLAILKKDSAFCDFCQMDNEDCSMDCHRGSCFKFAAEWSIENEI